MPISAPGGPITEVYSQTSKFVSFMSTEQPRIDVCPFKGESSANLSPGQLINKNPSELPQGVDPSKREVGNK